MADHTKVNLNEVEDMAPRFGLSPGLEARYARVPLALRNAGVSCFRIAPGFRTPFGHLHTEQEEVYVVLRGGGRVKLDDEIVELAPYDVVRIAPGVMRCVEGGPEGVEFLAFGAPNTENKDAELVQGWWADQPSDPASAGGD
jgi:mannose-6-phosphate isomerase-like protein (cupin superfamily)